MAGLKRYLVIIIALFLAVPSSLHAAPLEIELRSCLEDDSGTIDLEGTMAKIGDEILIPVKIREAANAVYSLGLEIAYNEQILEYSGFGRGNLVSSFTMFKAYPFGPGLLRVGGWTVGRGIAPGASGSLLWLIFTVKNGLENECYRLQPRNLVDDIAHFQATGGCICIKSARIWYQDADGDGYGTKVTTKIQSEQPDGYVSNPDDCDDKRAEINPDTVWYQDVDGDGYGTEGTTKIQCKQPYGYALKASDNCPDYYNPDQENNQFLVPDKNLLPRLIISPGQEVKPPTAIDLCSGQRIEAIADKTIPSRPGIYNITWIYGKAPGCKTQQQTVVVLDTDPPVPNQASLPNIIGECVLTDAGADKWDCKKISLTPPKATDKCAGEIAATAQNHLTFQSPGKYQVNWKYDDGNGNTVNQTQLVILKRIAHVGANQPFKTIQESLAAVSEGDKIMVAKGEYRQEPTITITKAVSLEGGWDPNFTVRNPKAYKTALSGTSIVFIDANGASLDGFVIENGNAGYNDALPYPDLLRLKGSVSGNIAYSGGGIYCKNSLAVISNCEIYNNKAYEAGGGIFCMNSSPTIINCTIKKNKSDFFGGGIYCLNSSPTIQNCSISENTAIYGGGISCDSSSFPTITNCTIWKNEASQQGAGIHIKDSSLKMTNCTLWANCASGRGGGIFSENSLLKVINSILWKDAPHEIESDSNCLVTYSLIQGGFGNAAHNIQTDPLFKDPNSRNFHLLANPRSPCIDAGTNEIALSTDKDGNSRPYDGDCDGLALTDIGAYEYIDNQPPVPDQDPLPALSGQCSLSLTPPTATDDCAGLVTATTTDQTLYTDQGTWTITWTYDDDHGNITQQQQTVTVHDTTPPVPDHDFLPDLQLECGHQLHLNPPTATDLCTGAVVATTNDNLSTATTGSFTLTWSYEDSYGNISSQQQRVKVVDTQKPVPDLDHLPDLVAENQITLTPPTATDICAGKITGTSPKLTYTEKGTHIVTWSYNDGQGNIARQEQRVIIERVFFVGQGQSSLKEAVNSAESGDKIRVAQGLYLDAKITLRAGVRFEGGWNSDFTERNPEIYPAILVGRATESVISFIDANIDANQTVIDGFTITHNNQARRFKLETGGAPGINCLNSSPTISNCVIAGNNAPYGAGIYCQQAHPMIIRCLIKENTADYGGGGIYWTDDSQPTILNCQFYHNRGPAGPEHIRLGAQADLQLVSEGQRIHFLIYDSLKELGKSAYSFFGAQCGASLSIGDDDVVIISLQSAY